LQYQDEGITSIPVTFDTYVPFGAFIENGLPSALRSL
jgi:hypothetical protein